jgi:hypothetical protein
MIKAFTESDVYGPIEFFLTVMAINMLAPEYGKHKLEEFFSKLKGMYA